MNQRKSPCSFSNTISAYHEYNLMYLFNIVIGWVQLFWEDLYFRKCWFFWLTNIFKKKKTFSNIFSIFSILNVRAKLSILDVFRSPGYASGYQKWKILQSCTVYVNFKKNYFSDLYQFLFRDISFKEFLFLKSQFSIYNRAKTR